MVTAVLWVLISLTGFIFAAIDVASAFGHYQLVKVGWPDQERLLDFTRVQLQAQTTRAVLLLVFLLVGINTLADGPRALFVYAMFFANIVVVAMAVRSTLYRREVFQYERRLHGNDDDPARPDRRGGVGPADDGSGWPN